MSIYYPNSCADLPPIICNNCQKKELGRIRSIWFQKQDFAFVDITNPTEWGTSICNKDVFVFPRTRGSLDMAETVEQGFGNQEESLSALTFTLNIMEPTYPENCDFWNQLKTAQNMLVGWRTMTRVYLSTATCNVIPKPNIPDDLKLAINWNIIAKFTQADVPCAMNLPVGVFDECIAC